jgi:uncharacterized protein (TIGR02246 family)
MMTSALILRDNDTLIIRFSLALLFLPLLLGDYLYSQDDRQAIIQLVDAYANARIQNDPDKIRSLFTSDADQLVSSGEWRHGMEALVEGMMRSTQNNPGDRTLTVETVRFMDRKSAIADARYEIKAPDGTLVRQMWSTFVTVRRKGRWKISAIRNMLPAR